jgi:uncharacterized membrane protein
VKIRGREISRIEAFSDAAFAFAVTLLVVSLEVPDSYRDLVDTLRGFPAFGVCFAILVVIWHHHYVFFRRYGLDDAATVVLNAVLIFVVLLYVYPLKFLFLFLAEAFFGMGGSEGRNIMNDPALNIVSLMTIYGIGVAAVHAVFILMYIRAWSLREAMALDESERFEIWSTVQHFAIYVVIALVSISIIQLGGSGFVSGIIYGLIGPVAGTHGAWRGRRRRQLSIAGKVAS